MNTSPTTLLTSAVFSEDALSPPQRAYFQNRLRARIHEVILTVFLEKKEEGFTKADLARRLGKAPEQVTRWLSAPGNLRLDTVSDLLLAMKHEPEILAHPIDLTLKSNHHHEMASVQPSIAGTSKPSSQFTITNKSGASDITFLEGNDVRSM